MKRGATLATATGFAELDADDIDFLSRHIGKLRKEGEAEGTLLSRFQQGSGIPTLLDKLRTAETTEFVEISAGLATRLQAAMDQATSPLPGVLAVLVSGTDPVDADFASVLKLDAIDEAASFAFKQGQVTLKVLRDLLPAPGQLQKGISWPDPRDASNAIIIDRNQSAARYFFNAYELQVSPTPIESERALGEAIVEGVDRDKRAEAMQFVADLSGPADKVAAQLKARYPDVQIDRRELGAAGALGGHIRPRKVPGHLTRFRGDGIVVTVPHERLDRIEGPEQVGGGWELTIRFSHPPQEESS